MDKRFDAVDKRFEEQKADIEELKKDVKELKEFRKEQKAFNEEKKAFNKKILQQIEGLSAENAIKFEVFCINWIKKQENLDFIGLRRRFPDPEHKVHTDQKFFEVDFFLEAPLIVGEATLTYNKKGKVQKFAVKCKELETRFEKPAKKYFFALGVQSEELKEELVSVCSRENIDLIFGQPPIE